MSENKTIKNFTAADIEKYWNKKLSPAEMHAIEKAAMDDPFLADALEGYRHSADPAKEVNALKEKFDKKFDDAAIVIPIHRKKLSWLRIAAAIIILVGAGLIIQQLIIGNNGKNSSLAGVEKTGQADKAKNESFTPQTGETDTALSPTSTQNKTQQVTNGWKAAEKNPDNSPGISSTDSDNTFELKVSDDKASGYVTADKKADVKIETEKKEIKDQALNESVVTAPAARLSDKENTTRANRGNFNQAGLLGNSFNYRVVDVQNNPVPFANVTNTRDNVGTYTDVRGYFNLMSSDSVLNVQVRSLGFNSENYRLTPSKQPNDLVLNEDALARNNMMDDIQGRSRVISSASRKDSAEVEEPEVGWGNYNTYVENNIKIPDNVRAKNSLNQVELSFDVDRYGQPVNIKVTKSSQCKACDEEAIRLLKEGPKWKKKGKRSKTTISITVDK